MAIQKRLAVCRCATVRSVCACCFPVPLLVLVVTMALDPSTRMKSVSGDDKGMMDERKKLIDLMLAAKSASRDSHIGDSCHTCPRRAHSGRAP